MTSITHMTSPGFWGKLPREPEFVSRGLPASFSESWDEWLQAMLAGSRELMGDGWLDAYLVCPIMHFVLGPGLCGENAWLGAWMASVDRVGRYFPLTVAQALPDGAAHLMPLLSKRVDELWLAPVQDAMLGVLGAQGYGADGLAQALLAVDSTSVYSACFAGRLAPGLSAAAPDRTRWAWSSEVMLDAADAILHRHALALEVEHAPMSAWFAHGSSGRDSELLLLRGLPDAAVFAQMLTGSEGAPPFANTEAQPTQVTNDTARLEESSDDTIPEGFLPHGTNSEPDPLEADMREFLETKLGMTKP